MITLGIETSCDETAVALVEQGRVLSCEVSSSVGLHSFYGGVVPEIASRYHTEYIFSVAAKALEDAGRTARDIGLIAVTVSPGLPGSLLVGIAFARALGFALDVPVMGVDHLIGHLVSCFLKTEERPGSGERYPFVGVVLSGGHTSIYEVRSARDIDLIGSTRDDAVGEAFDKVAKLLDLGYPGGPEVERLAGKFRGDDIIDFPRALLRDKDDLDFSFSGIKTAVMYHWKTSEKGIREKERICHSFQRAVTDVIKQKIMRAVRRTGMSKVAAGGGVLNNLVLRTELTELSKTGGLDLYLSPIEYSGDNAAMIASLGEELYIMGERACVI